MQDGFRERCYHVLSISAGCVWKIEKNNEITGIIKQQQQHIRVIRFASIYSHGSCPLQRSMKKADNGTRADTGKHINNRRRKVHQKEESTKI